MTVDSHLKPILDAMGAMAMPALDTIAPAVMRGMMDASPFPVEKKPVARITDQNIDGAEGPIPARFYWPVDEANLPVLLFFHGGGFVVGTLETHDALCRELSIASGALVISVAYRLAPEHKFPAAPEDCYAALCWAEKNVAAIGGDPNRIAVGGDSAGGNLAAVVALMARDRAGPAICHQALIYPVTDFNFETESYRDNAEGYFLTTEMMKWFWRHYLASSEEGQEVYASPLRAESLAGLPSTTLFTAQYDPLRDEGEAYHQRLLAAGNVGSFKQFPGMIHGFVSMLGITPQAMEAVSLIGQDLQAAFTRTA